MALLHNASVPLVWAYLRTAGGQVFRWSQAGVQLNDPSAYYGGKKEGRILSMSEISRELSDQGGIRSYTWTMVVEDTDAAIRLAAFTNTLRGAYVAVYMVDDTVRRALGTPFRIAGGLVTGSSPMLGPKYELTVTGLLGRKLSALNKEPRIPGHLLTRSEFPGLNDARVGRPAPVVFGAFNSQYVPGLPPVVAYDQGFIHAKFFGTLNLQTTFGGGFANVNVDAYLLSEGAVKSITALYATVREWGEKETSRLGDVVKASNPTATPYFFVCTTAGTSGTSEPAWNAGVGATTTDGTITWTRGDDFDPLARYEVPSASFAQDIACPFIGSGWATAGFTTTYVDHGGRRYTAFFIRNDHPFARAIRERRITIAADMLGLTTAADGTGSLLSDPGELLQFIVVNQVFGSTGWQSYVLMPQFDTPDGPLDYIDQDSVQAAKEVAEEIQPGNVDSDVPAGYWAAFVLGGEQDQQRLFEFLRDLCLGTGLEVGENRHGQLMVSRQSDSPSPAVTFTENDIIDGTFGVEVESAAYANRVFQRFARTYTPDRQPGTVHSAQSWLRTQGYTDTIARDAVGGLVQYDLDNMVVRTGETAHSVAQHYLAVVRGGWGWVPVPSFAPGFQDGARTLSFWTSLQGLGKVVGGVEVPVDLGTIISVRFREGPVATSDTYIVRVRAITIDPLKNRVRLSGRLVDVA